MQGKLRLLAVLAVLVLVMLPVGGVSAQPPIPQLFTGTVTIGGAPAPVGTTVSAWIEGVEVESVVTTTEGQYDMDLDPNDHVGKMVVFRVNGVVGGEAEFIDPGDYPMVICNLVTYTLSVTIDPADGGTVDLDPPDGDAVTPGAQYPSVDPVTVTVTADPTVGYQFQEWSGDLTGTVTPETLLMDDNKEVTAHFQKMPTESVETATGTGMACFTPNHGVIEDLEALPEIPPGAPACVTFPHGMFSFRVTGLDVGQTVTIVIELPDPVPVDFVWWKHHDGTWYDLPISIVDTYTIALELTDGVFPGDLDGKADGVITDPGGPGNPSHPPPPAAAGSAYPTWTVFLAAVVAAVSLLVLRRRQTQWRQTKEIA